MEDRGTPTSGHGRRAALDGGLEPSSFEFTPSPAGPRTKEDLHVCQACASQLVYPTTWAPADAKRWSVSLRCPECEWTGGGIYTQEILERFDEVLDSGTDAVLGDLKALARANMQEELERFVTALRADHILPED